MASWARFDGCMTGRVLFLGGTGVISAGSVALAARRGWEVTVLNRGQSTVRPVPDGVELISADVREPGAITAAIGDRRFDAVCDFLSFTPDQPADPSESGADRPEATGALQTVERSRRAHGS